MNLQDAVSTEIDIRKVQALLDSGVISQTDLDNAEIIDKTGEL